MKIKVSINSYWEEEGRFNVEQYLSHYSKKNNIFTSSTGTPWIRYENFAYTRFPIYNLTEASEEEIKEVFSITKSIMISFNVNSSDADSFLYICRNKNYSFALLPSNMQRNIKRAAREFTFSEIDREVFLTSGWKCFYDTRTRAGILDGNKENFLNQFQSWIDLSSNKIYGVMKENQLAAFISVSEINNWAEIGLYSSSQYLSLRPNDLIIYKVLELYLSQKKFSFVSFGLSSIQKDSSVDGLHKFKTKVGFEAIGIKRIFLINKKFNCLNNKLFILLLKRVNKIYPNSRRLRKIEGALERSTRW